MAEELREAASVEIDPWALFEVRLAAYLSTMVDPADEDTLELTVPRAEGEVSAIRVTAIEGGTALWAEMAGDETGRPIAESADMARAVREVLTFRHGTPHPTLVTAAATGPAAGGLGILGLARTEDVHADDFGDASRVIDLALHYPADRDALVAAVLGRLETRLGEALEFDEDGDIPVTVDGVDLWVRVLEDEPVVHLMSPVVDGVSSRRQAAVEVNILNRQHTWSRFFARGGRIWQTLNMPGYPFVPGLLDEMLRIFVRNHCDIRIDLAERLDGKTS